ncbi:MAG: hypothetical protein QNJ75_10605 [Acidimicrobiia bacterium]|nr:hypothetical protein [Acidimicrobiia bacterium]
MSLDDLGRRAADDARMSTGNARPPGLEAVRATVRRRSWMTRGALAAGTVGVAVAFAAVVGTLGGAEVTPLMSDPADSASTIPSSSTTTTAAAGPGVPVIPGAAAERLSLFVEPAHPGAALLTEETLTDEIVSSLQAALAGDAAITKIAAAFEKGGSIYATVEYSNGNVGFAEVAGNEVVRMRSAPDTFVDRHMIRKSQADWFGWTQITWVGLPDAASTVSLVTAQRPDDIPTQPVIGNAAFFEIGKPDWNQYGWLTAYDSNGIAVIEEQILLDGRSCSTGGSQPPAIVYATAPDAVETTRTHLQDAAGRCRVAVLEDLATGTGPYFGLPTDDLSAALREADRRYPLLLDIYDTVKLRHRTVESEQGTVYVWDTDTMEIGFLEDGTWQYGIILGEHPPLSGAE